MTGLSVRGLTVARGGRRVLEDASFTAPAGAVTMVLGLAGAGKTSLLAAIAGLLPIDRGAVFQGGTELTGLPPRRRDVAFLPPGSALPEARPLQGALRRLAGRGGADLAEARIGSLGLAGIGPTEVGLLSHGESLLALAAARLVRRASLCLVDEAGMGLDAPSAERFIAVLRQEAAGGCVVLAATRSPAIALQADHLVLLQAGRVIQSGTPASLYAEPSSTAAALLCGPANILQGHVREVRPGGFLWAGGGRFLQTIGPETKRPVLGGPVALCLRPERLALLAEGQDEDNVTDADIVDVRSAGACLQISAQAGLGLLRIAVPSWPRGAVPTPGQRTRIGWKADAALVLA